MRRVDRRMSFGGRSSSEDSGNGAVITTNNQVCATVFRRSFSYAPVRARKLFALRALGRSLGVLKSLKGFQARPRDIERVFWLLAHNQGCAELLVVKAVRVGNRSHLAATAEQRLQEGLVEANGNDRTVE